VNAQVLVRGDVEMPAQEVERGFLQVLDAVGKASIKPGRSGRRELAEWLTSKENPLTARVVVNRIWMHLLGDPLMGSPNNWGTTGQKPTHPVLLDYLAVRFMENEWSIKSVIREIVLSKTCQRSSGFDRRNYEADPDNRLLWRANPRQLDAESLRDSTLVLSGNLDLERPHGSEVAEVGDKRVGRTVDPTSFSQDNHHRSVYLPILRDSLPESLALFDFADPSVTTPQRDATNVPSQSLFLMNNPFVTEQARAMATNLADQFNTTEQRVRHAFLLAYGRTATTAEVQTSVQFFKRFLPEARKNSTGPATQPFRNRPNQGTRRRPFGQRNRGAANQQTLTPEQQTLMAFCQGLMASAEFRILN